MPFYVSTFYGKSKKLPIRTIRTNLIVNLAAHFEDDEFTSDYLPMSYFSGLATSAEATMYNFLYILSLLSNGRN